MARANMEGSEQTYAGDPWDYFHKEKIKFQEAWIHLPGSTIQPPDGNPHAQLLNVLVISAWDFVFKKKSNQALDATKSQVIKALQTCTDFSGRGTQYQHPEVKGILANAYINIVGMVQATTMEELGVRMLALSEWPKRPPMDVVVVMHAGGEYREQKSRIIPEKDIMNELRFLAVGAFRCAPRGSA